MNKKEITLTIPFRTAVSKNRGHRIKQSQYGLATIVKTKDLRSYTHEVHWLIRAEIMKKPWKFENGKIWLTVFVYKPRKNADAINVLDTLADIIKNAIEVDDQYFAVRELDYDVDTANPRIILGICQESGIM